MYFKISRADDLNYLYSFYTDLEIFSYQGYIRCPISPVALYRRRSVGQDCHKPTKDAVPCFVDEGSDDNKIKKSMAKEQGEGK